MKSIILLVALLYGISSYAQGGSGRPTKGVISNAYLTRAGLNRIINKSFGNITTGHYSNTAFANYASLDPADGSFSFKGTIPVGKDTNRLSFLSLRLDGDLVSESFASLFSNSALNTNTSVRAEYYLRIPNFSKNKGLIRNLASEKANLRIQKAFIEREQLVNFQMVDIDTAYLRDAQQRISIQQQVVVHDTLTVSQAYYSYQNDSLQHYKNPLKYDRLKVVLDTLGKLQTTLLEAKKLLVRLEQQKDSIATVLANLEGFRDYKRGALLAAAQTKVLELEINAPITYIRYNWIAFIGALGKKKYYTFDPILTYEQQIQKQELNTYSFGIALNHYQQNVLKKHSLYTNLGVLRMHDNNTMFLSTQTVEQEREFSRSDTTRKITKKYNVYTDPIKDYRQWSVFANAYYMFSGTSGLHVYPSVDFRDGSSTLSHLGFGCAMSFLNDKKDQPVINIEGYIQFIDLFNKLKSDSRFWKRNDIGIRLTLPINFYVGKLNIDEHENQ